MANFGMKDIYEGSFLAVEDVSFGNTSFSKDDTVLYLQNIRTLEIIGQDSNRTASGGYENLKLIDWSKIDNAQGMISMGVVNKIAMSLSTGLQLQTCDHSLIIPIVEECFIDLSGKIQLKHTPFGRVNIFEKRQGNRIRQILDFSIQQNTLILEEKGIDVEIDYFYNYQNESDYISVGNSFLNGYFKFVGKFYYTDEVTQEQKTGIIEIPKLKFLPNVKIGLGRNTTPTISDLYFSVEPQGEKRNKKFFNLYFLNDKI